MQEKLAKARARAQILENMEFGEEQGLHEEMLVYRQQSLYFRQTKKENFKVPTVNKIVIFWIKHTKLNKKRNGFLQKRTLFGALCHLVKQQSDIELDVFDENPLDFHYFMTLTHGTVEKKNWWSMRKIAKIGQIHKWEFKRDDQTLCTGTINYGFSTCKEDTRGEILKLVPW